MAIHDRSALPYPGDELVYRVTGVTGVAPEAIREWFAASGEQSVRDMSAALALLGRDLRSFRRVLDFGCGPGRLLLQLRDVAESGVQLHGADIDQRAIHWARAHIPWAQFDVNAPLPPLPYEDGTFDLILNHSVFTHIDEDYQDQWLTELHRVTVPGAVLLLSVNGEHAFGEFERQTRENGGDPAAVRVALAARGIVFLQEDSWLGSAFPDFYHSTFHTPGYVMEHWGSFFDVRAYLPRHALGHQDLVVLQRRPGALIAPAPEPVLAEQPVGVAARRARLGLRRPYSAHQRALLHAVALRLGVQRRTVTVVPRNDAIGELRDGLLRQSERISRLELELIERIDELSARLERLES